MSNDAINNWVERARQSADSAGDDAAPETGGVQVIRRVQPSKGAVIMEFADKILPWVKHKLNGVRDNDGMLVQPATVRAIALNVAQSYLLEEETLRKQSNA